MVGLQRTKTVFTCLHNLRYTVNICFDVHIILAEFSLSYFINLPFYHYELWLDFIRRIWHVHNPPSESRNEPLVDKKGWRGKSRGGYSEKCPLKKKHPLRGTLELFLLYKEPHQTAALEIRSLCSFPASRSSGEKKRKGGRKKGGGRDTVSILKDNLFGWFQLIQAHLTWSEPHQKRHC